MFVTYIKGDEDQRNGKNHCGGMDLDDWSSNKEYVIVRQKLMEPRFIKIQSKGDHEIGNYILKSWDSLKCCETITLSFRYFCKCKQNMLPRLRFCNGI